MSSFEPFAQSMKGNFCKSNTIFDCAVFWIGVADNCSQVLGARCNWNEEAVLVIFDLQHVDTIATHKKLLLDPFA